MVPVPDARLELQIGGLWTDVTDDLRVEAGIKHSRGRRDEGTRVDRASLAFTLASPAGKYSDRNPLSPYYGLLPRNTPARLTTYAGETALRITGEADRATTPDVAALDIVGDIDVRIEARLINWNTTSATFLLGKYVDPSQRSWELAIQNGHLFFGWSTTGSNFLERFSDLLPVPASGRLAVRVTMDVNDGAGNHVVTFYTSDSISGTWTQLGSAVVTAGVTSIFSSTAPFEVGDVGNLSFLAPIGEIQAAQVRSGIGGSIVANPIFTAQAAGTTVFVDSAGRSWSFLGSAAITDRRTRCVTEVSEWPPSWHVSGHNVTVDLQASGILRRLGQGSKALQSTLRRRVPSFAPMAYWPCEEEDGATQAYSPITGVGPLRVTGWQFGQDETLAGSSALPTVAPGGSMVGFVPAPVAAITAWSWQMVYQVDSAPVTAQTFLGWTSSGTVGLWKITMTSGQAVVRGEDRDGAAVVNASIAIGADVFAGWNRMEFRATQNGGNVDWTINWVNIGGAGGSLTASYAGTVGRPGRLDTTFGTGISGLRVGHIAAFPVAASAAYSLADHGFSGETAGTRGIRLAGEEGIPFKLVGLAADQVPNGPQRPDTFLSLLAECEETDGGILYEDRDRLGLAYRGRTTLYNQTPKLTISYDQLTHPFEPVDDDDKLRNDITVTRRGGSSARAVQETGPLSVDVVGVYDDSVSLNLYDDSQPEQIAGWRRHLGTIDEARYRTIRILLHKYPELIPAVCSLDVGDVVRITDLPPHLPPGPVDVMVDGYSEELGPLEWYLTLVCSPASPWTVGVVEDDILGRADTDGSELVSALTPTGTTALVLATEGPTWTRDPGEVPFDVVMGGELVTVSAITGVAEDDFSTAQVSSWGTADVGGAWTTGGGVATDYNVTSGRGTHTLTSVNTSRRSFVAATMPDVDVQVDIQTSALATGAALTGGLAARYIDSDNLYTARVAFDPGGTVTLTIRERLAAVETQLAVYTVVGLTHVANTDVRLRFRVAGSDLMAKVWSPTLPEPWYWQLLVTDTSLPSSTLVGCRSLSVSGNTNVSPIIRYDNLVILNPTRWTVARSVNGIVKAQSAGTDVRLYTPMRAAL